VTSVSGGVSSTVVYYKSATAASCGAACPSGQFIDAAVPNLCVLCDPSCALCQVSATFCQACVSPFVLHSLTSTCVSVCPIGFYQSANSLSVGTFLSLQCTSCDPLCAACSGGTFSDCTACHNMV
jgi:proprotein convertase subtilisin/kexin type 5